MYCLFLHHSAKLMNCGQTCVAPDYILVPHSLLRPLAIRLREAVVQVTIVLVAMLFIYFPPVLWSRTFPPPRLFSNYKCPTCIASSRLPSGPPIRRCGIIVLFHCQYFPICYIVVFHGGQVNLDDHYVSPTILVNPRSILSSPH